MDTSTFYEKLSLVPSTIRVQFGSDVTMDAVELINKRFHISQKDRYIIAKLLQRLQIKDLDSEYFAGELSVELNLDKNNALAITSEIKRVILMPLRKELSDYGIDIALLDKFQTPIIQPKILNEIVSPQPNLKIPTPAPAPKPPGPQIISESFSASPNIGATPLASNRNTPGAAPSPNKPDSDKGWSTRTPQNPVVTLGAITPAIPSPATTTNKPPTIDLSQQPKSNTSSNSSSTTAAPSGPAKGMSEFDRLDMMKRNNAPGASAPSPVVAPTQVPAIPKPPTPPSTPSAAPKDPAPIMLHEISASSAQSPQFRVNISMQNQMGGNAPRTPMPSKPAVLEFGGEANSANSSAGAPATPKAVHYSEYKTASDNGAPRQITEITKPAAGTTAPVPAKPPTPPPPPNKVIVKDFLS